MLLENNICKIKICEDTTYTLESTDNKNYDLILNPQNLKRSSLYKVFSIYIDLFYEIISIALVGELYSDDTDCAILDKNILTILQNDVIVQINIYDASLLLFKEIGSFGCNFGIHKVKEGYIIHGEIEITMLDFQFNKKWVFSGRDIFVSISGNNPFQLCNDSIKLYDFEDNFYEINYNGQLVSKT